MRHILLGILLLGNMYVHAQKQGQAKLDSLLAALPTVKTDEIKADVLLDISFTYKNIDPAKGLKYAKEGMEFSEQIGWKRGVAKGHNSFGNNYKASSDYPNALNHYLQALKIYQELDDKKNIPILLMNIGTVYRPMHEYAKALEYYQKALEISSKQGNKRLTGLLMGNISVVCFEKGDQKGSVEYNRKALKIFEEIDDKSNIAWITENIGDDYAKAGDNTNAIKYYERALQIDREINDKKDEASGLENLGVLYRELAKKANNAALKKEYLQKSVKYIEDAMAINADLNDIDYLKNSYEDLSISMEDMGDYKRALDNYKTFAALKDSIFSSDKRVAIANLGTQKAEMDSEQQAKLNKILNKRRRNEAIFFISGIVLLLIVTGFVIKERRKSDKLLLNILPGEVAGELKRKGTAAAKNFNDVTVLFTDFVNFTSLVEKMPPQQLVDELHTCFKAFDAIITKYDIEKIKTVGDAYLAVSGLPVANARHAENMVAAAIEIRDYMLSRKQKMGDNTFDLRIGINSGSVVAGIVGVKKFAYDIWGDTVNIAARMEQNSEQGKINISQTTYELVKDKYNCVYRGEIEAKNKGKLSMYFVERIATS